MRSLEQRQTDTLAKLEQGKRDAWVATAGPHGQPHLVPFSLSWDGHNVLLATEAGSRTVHNVQSSHQVRLAIGDTRDVVLIDAEVQLVPIAELDPTLAGNFAARHGWDPRRSKTPMVWLVCRPQRIQAWENEPELSGRTIMTGGRWLK